MSKYHLSQTIHSCDTRYIQKLLNKGHRDGKYRMNTDTFGHNKSLICNYLAGREVPNGNWFLGRFKDKKREIMILKHGINHPDPE